MTSPSPAHLAALAKLREEAAFRVRERACLIHEACGVSWLEADRRALAEEGVAQVALPGMGSSTA